MRGEGAEGIRGWGSGWAFQQIGAGTKRSMWVIRALWDPPPPGVMVH